MAVKSRKADTGPLITRRRVAAIAAQLMGFGTTWAFIAGLGLADLVGFGVAVVVEWLLFEFKRTVLNGEGKDKALGVAAILVDSLLNAGGMWVWVLNIDGTEAYKMLAQALALGESMRLVPALLICLALGFALAVAPHQLWKELD